MEVEEVPYQFLEDITDGFSEDQLIGYGAYGAVYRGVTNDGNEVAVKIFKDNSPLANHQFRNEFHHPRMLKHPNVVQVLGYCYETKKTPVRYKGQTVHAEVTYRALCFEYLQNGCLQKHISDESHELDWHTRYNIIKGTCEGLQYILGEHLYHLDLKPDNILLDKDMLPKIIDFGISKLIHEVTATTHPVDKELEGTTSCLVGTPGYQPPEHIDRGEISEKFDIFSLGVVMIQIISGYQDRFKYTKIPHDEFIDLERKNWRNRLKATWSGSSLETYCNQVEICTKIALSCTKYDSHGRPSIKDIIDTLKESEIKIAKSTHLQVEPLQLQFPFEQENSMKSCSLKLTSHTDKEVVFRLVNENPINYLLLPVFGIVHSRCIDTLTVTIRGKLLKPQENGEEYFTLESITADHHEIQNAISYNDEDSYDRFFAKAKESGREMHQVKLTIVHRPPVLEKATTTTKLPSERYCKTVSTSLSSTRIPDQHQNSILVRSTRHNELEYVDIQETPSDASEVIVGRTEEKEKIIDSLLASIEKNMITIIPIYGLGGIGKTTFAKMIYNDFKHFSRAWVYVSPVFDLNMIQSSVKSQLHEKDSQTDERQGIHVPKKTMIVLDDLWEVKEYELDSLREILFQGESNTVVLVTTRTKDVAKRICANHEPYEIESLKVDMCWDIIKQRSSFEARSFFEARHDKVELTRIGKAIAEKCGGVALAAKSIGFMLQSKGFDDWKQVKESDIWNETISSENTSATNSVLASLKLSYENMVESFKFCFTYCAIFPKGHKIVRDDLIYHWLSLGCITATKLLTPRQRCDNCIAQLLGLSFLQHSVLPTSSRAYAKGVTLFTMHDLVHDLARLIMGHEILVGSRQDIVAEHSSRYALLTDCSKALGSYTSYPEEIRALLFEHCGKIDVCGRAFLSAESLRVLDLSGCSIEELPDCISKLPQLRYLKAQNIESDKIPFCISRLRKLIYLNISGSGFSELPGTIGQINDVRYVDMSDCTRLQFLPGSFWNLERLVHLDLSSCWCLDSIASVLAGMTNLEYLNLSLEGSHLSYSTHLQKRTVGNVVLGVPGIIGNLTKLRYLGLSNAMNDVIRWGPSRTFGFLEKICTLSNLERLDLSHNYSICHVPDSIVRLKKLHALDLSGCRQLTGLPECIVEMDSLKVLNVAGCSELKKQPAAPSGSNTITFLPQFKVCAEVDDPTSNIVVLRHEDPVELHISSLENVKSAEEARSINLIQKKRIGSLTLEWTRGAAGKNVEDVELLAELVPPRNLMKFCMKGYNSASFPDWVIGIRLCLPDLIKIELCDVTEIICLPPLGQLPKLQELVMEGLDSITIIGEGLCGGARSFPQLTKFCLRSMRNLEEWNTMYFCGEEGAKKFMFPNLEDLSICHCLKLTLKPCAPRARIWEIVNSDHVLSSLRDGETASAASSSFASATAAITQLRITACLFPNLSLMRSLRLQDIIALDEIPEWFGNLVSLQELVITMCTQLRNLQHLSKLVALQELVITRCPESRNLKHLSSLRLLSLKECPSIAVLPEWSGCLEELVISECRSIMYLPKSILTNLKLLYIYYCPELVQWCKENMMQFDHIEDKIMLDNSSQCCQFSLFACEHELNAQEMPQESRHRHNMQDTPVRVLENQHLMCASSDKRDGQKTSQGESERNMQDMPARDLENQHLMCDPGDKLDAHDMLQEEYYQKHDTQDMSGTAPETRCIMCSPDNERYAQDMSQGESHQNDDMQDTPARAPEIRRLTCPGGTLLGQDAAMGSPRLAWLSLGPCAYCCSGVKGNKKQEVKAKTKRKSRCKIM